MVLLRSRFQYGFLMGEGGRDGIGGAKLEARRGVQVEVGARAVCDIVVWRFLMRGELSVARSTVKGT